MILTKMSFINPKYDEYVEVTTKYNEILSDYYEKGIFSNDPFKTIDIEGVGKLVEVGVTLAKRSNPNIHLGICGEHGGDEKSIEFFNRVGLDYVSCSPYRVPSAILASAKAAVKERNK